MTKIWNLEYKISDLAVVGRSPSDPQLLMVRHRIAALNHDPHVQRVDSEQFRDERARYLIYAVHVTFKPGLTQPQNKELWHLDVLQGKTCPTWYEHLEQDHFFPV